MLMPTSHFLGQVWEFPICGSAPAQHSQDDSDFGCLLTFHALHRIHDTTFPQP